MSGQMNSQEWRLLKERVEILFGLRGHERLAAMRMGDAIDLREFIAALRKGTSDIQKDLGAAEEALGTLTESLSQTQEDLAETNMAVSAAQGALETLGLSLAALGEQLGTAEEAITALNEDTEGLIDFKDSFTTFGSTLGASANAAAARGHLELGSAALASTGASGHALPFLDIANIWSAIQTLSGGGVLQAGGLATWFIDSPAGAASMLRLMTAGLDRWRVLKGSAAEGGANAGSPLQLTCHNDAGVFLRVALEIARDTGLWKIDGAIQPASNITRDLGSAAAAWRKGFINNPAFGFRTVTGDANFTLTPGVTPYETVHAGTITANRTCTLSTAGVEHGDKFRLVRTGAGAFTISFGGLKNLAQNTAAVATYSAPAAAWLLTEYCTL